MISSPVISFSVIAFSKFIVLFLKETKTVPPNLFME